MSSTKPYNRLENPYLKLGFWKFLVLSTAMVVFFPWSILFCLIIFGLEETKLIIFALIEDFIKTFIAILLGILFTITIITITFVMWLKSPDDSKIENNQKSHGYGITFEMYENNQGR
tara:strand:+ start:963 stop:1313 length:351 start_codon:yes stop_codon:yes gene_type:complete